MILFLSTGVNGDDFRMGAESCRWINMQILATFNPKCAISQSQTMKSQRSISNELQNNANMDLISIFKKFHTIFCNSYVSSLAFFWLLINQFGAKVSLSHQQHRHFYGLSRSNWNKFSIVSFSIFKVNIVVEQYNKHNWWRFFGFHKLPLPSTFLLPLPPLQMFRRPWPRAELRHKIWDRNSRFEIRDQGRDPDWRLDNLWSMPKFW